MPVNVTLTRNEFGRIAAELPGKVAIAVTATVDGIAAAASAAAPFPDITVAVEHAEVFRQYVTVEPWWAGFWEYGTRNFAAHPFLIPAAEAFRQPFNDLAAASLRL